MKAYKIYETDCPDEYVYNIKAKNITEVRDWVINHLDTSIAYTIEQV